MGQRGADIACGEGQPLGIPLASGGPYFGFFCCTKTFVRQMPGRIIGRTVDQDGKTGFILPCKRVNNIFVAPKRLQIFVPIKV